MLDEHPVRRAVLEHSWRPGWISDWLASRPTVRDSTFADEVDDVRALGDKRVRAYLRESTPERSLPRILSSAGHRRAGGRSCSSGCGPTRSPPTGAAASACSAPTSSRAPRGWPPTAGRPCCATSGETASGSATASCGSTATTCPRACSTTTPTSSSSPRTARATWVGWDLPRRYAIYYPVTGALARGRRPGRRRPRSARRRRPRPAAAHARRPVEHERARRQHRYAARLGR